MARKGAPKAAGKRASTPSASRNAKSQQDAQKPAKRQRYQPKRRDVDAKVERTLTESGRISHIPKAVWAVKTNDRGQTLAEYTAEGLEALHEDKQRLGSKWWANTFDMFGLHHAVPLPEPHVDDEEGGDTPPDELLECLAACHCDNVVRASIVPLERFLEYCGSMNEVVTHGLLSALTPSPTLTLQNAVRGQVAVMKAWARTGDHHLHPKYMEAMRISFDYAMKSTWGNLAEGGLMQKSFWNTHRGAFSLLAPDDFWARAFENDTVAHAPDDVMTLVETETGKAMFQAELLKLGGVVFQAKIEQKINDLQREDWDPVAVAAFQELMKLEVRQLVDTGVKRFDKVQSTLVFFVKNLRITADSVDDEWQVRFAARLKMAAVNNGQLRRTPWEELTIEPGSIEQAPRRGKIPDDLLVRAAAARDEIWNVCGLEQLTLEEMKSKISGREKNFKKLDDTFSLELEYLFAHAEESLKEVVKTNILNSLPEGSNVVPTVREGARCRIADQGRSPGGRARGVDEIRD